MPFVDERKLQARVDRMREQARDRATARMLRRGARARTVSAAPVGQHAPPDGLTNSMMRLDPADIEAIAQRVVLLMRDEQPQPMARLVDAAGLAALLGVDRSWVYAHAKELHAVRLGGPRGRMRFDLAVVLPALNAEPAPVRATPPRRRAKLMQFGGELLPIDS